jgi:hypothetical protein
VLITAYSRPLGATKPQMSEYPRLGRGLN